MKRLTIAISIVILLALSNTWSTVTQVSAIEPTPKPTEVGVQNSQFSVNGAATRCCGISSSTNIYPCCGDGTIKTKGNCTWYAYYKYAIEGGNNFCFTGAKDAKDWAQCAQPSGSPPRIGSVVVFPPGSGYTGGYNKNGTPNNPYGHVVYVEDIRNGRVYVSQQGCFTRCDGTGTKLNCQNGHCIWSYPQNSVERGVYIYPNDEPPPSIPSDVTPPNNPISLNSSTHVVGQPSPVSRVTVMWSGASDPGANATGIGGYSWVWTREANTLPQNKDTGDENIRTATSWYLYGGSWYFHLRTRDKAGNWSPDAIHIGPFNIALGCPGSQVYAICSSVQANSGALHSSSTYRLHSTGGQPTKGVIGDSTQYRLYSGFQGAMLSVQVPDLSQYTMQQRSSIASTAYGVTINDGNSYVNDLQVTLTFTAPVNTAEMMLSDRADFQSAYWEAFAITRTYELRLSAVYTAPSSIYVKFKDNSGNMADPYSAKAIYDYDPPYGTAAIQGRSSNTVTLQIELQNDISPIIAMAATTDANADYEWLPISKTLTVPYNAGDTVIYLYFKDSAGNVSFYPYEVSLSATTQQIYLPLIVK